MGRCTGNDESAGKQLVSLVSFLKVFGSHNIHVLYIMSVFVPLTSMVKLPWVSLARKFSPSGVISLFLLFTEFSKLTLLLFWPLTSIVDV